MSSKFGRNRSRVQPTPKVCKSPKRPGAPPPAAMTVTITPNPIDTMQGGTVTFDLFVNDPSETLGTPIAVTWTGTFASKPADGNVPNDQATEFAPVASVGIGSYTLRADCTSPSSAIGHAILTVNVTM